MTKLRFALLCALAVGVLGLLDTVPASAESLACPQTSGFPTLCIEKAMGVLTAENVTVTFAAVTANPMKLEVPSTGLEVECGVKSTTGKFEQATLLVTPGVKIREYVAEFSTCTALKPVNANNEQLCEALLGKTNDIEGFFNNTTPIEDMLLNPENGAAFAVLDIKNKPGKTCPVAVENGKLTGETLCLEKLAELVGVKGKVDCKKEGSKLLFAGKEAKYELFEEIELTGAEKGLPYTFRLI